MKNMMRNHVKTCSKRHESDSKVFVLKNSTLEVDLLLVVGDAEFVGAVVADLEDGVRDLAFFTKLLMKPSFWTRK